MITRREEIVPRTKLDGKPDALLKFTGSFHVTQGHPNMNLGFYIHSLGRTVVTRVRVRFVNTTSLGPTVVTM